MNDNWHIVTMAERPDLIEPFGRTTGAIWPEYMKHNDVVDRHWTGFFEVFGDYQFALLDDHGQILAVGMSIPLAWDDEPACLPDEGWEWAVEQGFADHAVGKTSRALSALQIVVRPDLTGQHLSGRVVTLMRELAVRHDLHRLIAPVRPNRKCDYPLIPMDEYIRWTTPDGLPFDPWLRVHARLGARIVKVCPQAYCVRGSVGDWEKWAARPFPGTGQYLLPMLLNPIDIDRGRDFGSYVEPNVWVVHDLA